MNRKIIVIAGYLAAGKSTFARRLSAELKIPCLIKDTFKSALCASVDINNREDSSRFSAVTFDAMLYVTERLIEVGTPVILEGNFVPKGLKRIDEAGAIKTLIDKNNCDPLTFKFTGDTAILHNRFVKRDITPERGHANMLFYEPSLAEFDTWCHNLDPFDIGGEVVEVNGTDFHLTDFERHVETARMFLKRLL